MSDYYEIKPPQETPTLFGKNEKTGETPTLFGKGEKSPLLQNYHGHVAEHGHEHGHGHDHAEEEEEEEEEEDQGRKKLCRAMALCLFFMTAEVVGGFFAGSLAILTDAAHLLADFAAMAIGIFAISLTKQKATREYSFGFHRAEILGALMRIWCVLIIWLATGGLVVAAVNRIITPQHVDGPLMFGLACLGLVVNVLMLFILTDGGSHSHSHGGGHGHSHGLPDEEDENVNVRAMYIHIIGDLIQAIGVVIAGLLIWLEPFDVGTYKCDAKPEGCSYWSIADPICTMFFAVLVLCTTYNIVWECVDVIMEKVPTNVNCEKLVNELLTLKNVVDVHDLHVWTMSKGKNAASCHITIQECCEGMDVLRTALQVCEKHNCPHTTIQLEVQGVKIHDEICHSSFKTSTVGTKKIVRTNSEEHKHGHEHGHGHECSGHGDEHGHGDDSFQTPREHGHGEEHGHGDVEHGHGGHGDEHGHGDGHQHGPECSGHGGHGHGDGHGHGHDDGAKEQQTAIDMLQEEHGHGHAHGHDGTMTARGDEQV